MALLNGVPVIGFCGYSGSGKTTIIEKVVPRLARRGLAVAYLKHDAHALQVDREGKDTDRIFKAGARVIAAGSSAEGFVRTHGGEEFVCPPSFAECDIILVEGYKDAPWEKIWVHPHGGGEDVIAAKKVIREIGGRSSLRHNETEQIADQIGYWLVRSLLLKPLYAGILVGGKSVRMGRPKSLLPAGNATLVEHVHGVVKGYVNRIYLLGSGPLPPALAEAERIADAPGFEGPLAGLVAAHRFAPDADWLLFAVDMPNIDGAYVGRFGRRDPAFRFMGPRSEKGLEPLASCYSSQLLARMAREHGGEMSIARLLEKFGVKGDSCLYDPVRLINVNTPEDLSLHAGGMGKEHGT